MKRFVWECRDKKIVRYTSMKKMNITCASLVSWKKGLEPHKLRLYEVTTHKLVFKPLRV